MKGQRYPHRLPLCTVRGLLNISTGKAENNLFTVEHRCIRFSLPLLRKVILHHKAATTIRQHERSQITSSSAHNEMRESEPRRYGTGGSRPAICNNLRRLEGRNHGDAESKKSASRGFRVPVLQTWLSHESTERVLRRSFTTMSLFAPKLGLEYGAGVLTASSDVPGV